MNPGPFPLAVRDASRAVPAAMQNKAGKVLGGYFQDEDWPTVSIIREQIPDL